jgi:hypothetical protein
MASAVTLPISALGQVLAAPVGLAEPGWAEWLFARVREAGTLMAASSLLGLAAYWLFGRYGAVRPSAPPGKLARVAVPDAPPAPA